MKNIFWLLLCLFVGSLLQSCKKVDRPEKELICRITVNTGDLDRKGSVASLLLDEITFAPDTLLTLIEIAGKEKVHTDVQFEISGNKRYMYWILNGFSPRGIKRHYELVMKKSNPSIGHIPVSLLFRDGGYEFVFKGKKVLKYNSEAVQPPKGIEPLYQRSGFINPLYAPNQSILTRIPDSASDHLHHYGLWSAWKKVRFRGEELDFFAPQFGQGTVRHAGVVSMDEGAVFASLKVLLEHITWQGTVKEARAMSDLTEIRVYNNDLDWHLVDLSFQYSPVDSFLIEEYAYAGFSFRGTDHWTRENTTFFTSEGMNRDQASGERSKWCVVTGDTPLGAASILFMSHPSNYNHPEPMRIWPSDSNNGTGNIYVNYNPAGNSNWLLLPGKSWLLRYRLLVTDGGINASEAEEAWNDFANPVKVSWEK